MLKRKSFRKNSSNYNTFHGKEEAYNSTFLSLNLSTLHLSKVSINYFLIKMKHNFTIRIHKETDTSSLSDLKSLTISNITILSKDSKYNDFCFYNGNKKKYGYSMEIKGKFNKVSGSYNYPTLSFKGDYIDIVVKDFPRYPAFYQDMMAVRNFFNGYSYTNYINQGFPTVLKYRNIEILPFY